jgi:hypothetical protein
MVYLEFRTVQRMRVFLVEKQHVLPYFYLCALCVLCDRKEFFAGIFFIEYSKKNRIDANSSVRNIFRKSRFM